MPDHPPEVPDRRLHRALSHDVGLRLNKALKMLAKCRLFSPRSCGRVSNGKDQVRGFKSRLK